MESESRLTGQYHDIQEQIEKYLDAKELYPDESKEAKEQLLDAVTKCQNGAGDVTEMIGANMHVFGDQLITMVRSAYQPKKAFFHMIEVFWKALFFSLFFNLVDVIGQSNWRLWNGNQDALLCYLVATLTILIEDIIVYRIRKKRDMSSQMYRFRRILPFVIMIFVVVIAMVVTDLLKLYAMTDLFTMLKVAVFATAIGGLTYGILSSNLICAREKGRSSYLRDYEKKASAQTWETFICKCEKQNHLMLLLFRFDLVVSGILTVFTSYLLYINKNWQLWVVEGMALILYAAACAFLTTQQSRTLALIDLQSHRE